MKKYQLFIKYRLIIGTVCWTHFSRYFHCVEDDAAKPWTISLSTLYGRRNDFTAQKPLSFKYTTLDEKLKSKCSESESLLIQMCEGMDRTDILLKGVMSSGSIKKGGWVEDKLCPIPIKLPYFYPQFVRCVPTIFSLFFTPLSLSLSRCNLLQPPTVINLQLKFLPSTLLTTNLQKLSADKRGRAKVYIPADTRRTTFCYPVMCRYRRLLFINIINTLWTD